MCVMTAKKEKHLANHVHTNCASPDKLVVIATLVAIVLTAIVFELFFGTQTGVVCIADSFGLFKSLCLITDSLTKLGFRPHIAPAPVLAPSIVPVIRTTPNRMKSI